MPNEFTRNTSEARENQKGFKMFAGRNRPNCVIRATLGALTRALAASCTLQSPPSESESLETDPFYLGADISSLAPRHSVALRPTSADFWACFVDFLRLFAAPSPSPERANPQ
jgi:hypothetical protein